MDLAAALAHLGGKLGADPPVPDADGRIRLALAGGLELALVPVSRGRLVAEVGVGTLPAAAGTREERLRLLLGRSLAMMRSAADAVLAVDAAGERLTLWRHLDLPELSAADLEEAVARLLDDADWLRGDPLPAPARPAGPLLFFP